nr:hypothetical protein [uncultured Methanobrevibacter sp.]
MEKKYIALIVVAAVIIIAVAAAFVYTNNPKQDTKLEVVGNSSIPEDGKIVVRLSALNGTTSLKNKEVHVAVFNSDGKQVFNKTKNTSDNGKASFALKNVTAGKKYTVNVTFDGDKNYSANKTSKKIKITEKQVVEETPEPVQSAPATQSSQDSSQSYNIDDMDGDGQLDVFYSEGYNDDVGMIQYYNTRGGEHLEVYEDGSYYYMGADGSEDYGYVY